VGKTGNPQFRLEQHFNSTGSVWTTKYKPVSVLELIKDCDEYDEDKYTRKYMDKFGVDNVRGGSFCEEVFHDTTLTMLNKMKNTAENRCFTCGQTGHYAENCTTKINNNDTQYSDDISELLKNIEGFIQDQKIKENIDMSKENLSHLYGIYHMEKDYIYYSNKCSQKKDYINYSDNCSQKHVDMLTRMENEYVSKKNQYIERPRSACSSKAESGNGYFVIQMEYDRVRKQKEKNNEYLPMMETVYKSIKLLNDKINTLTLANENNI